MDAAIDELKRRNIGAFYFCLNPDSRDTGGLLRRDTTAERSKLLLIYSLTYLRTYVLTYLRTYVLTYLRTYVLTYLRTYILTPQARLDDCRAKQARRLRHSAVHLGARGETSRQDAVATRTLAAHRPLAATSAARMVTLPTLTLTALTSAATAALTSQLPLHRLAASAAASTTSTSGLPTARITTPAADVASSALSAPYSPYSSLGGRLDAAVGRRSRRRTL